MYEISNKSYKNNLNFEASEKVNEMTKKIANSAEINDDVIDQAVSILNSIDPWIIERILEPFEDKEGRTGIWLYCHGNWRLFVEEKKENFRSILKSTVEKAL